MAKHLLDLKLEVAKLVLAGPDGHKRVAARYGLSPSMVRRWTAAYKAHGLTGLKKPYGLYPIDIRHQAVQSVLTDGLSIYEAMDKYNIPTHTTIEAWVRLYNEGGIDALQNKPRGRPKMSKQEKPKPLPEKPLEEMTREELLEELEYRRTEVAYLKKLRALVQSRQLTTKPKR